MGDASGTTLGAATSRGAVFGAGVGDVDAAAHDAESKKASRNDLTDE
jgi:hypothetical protein